MFRRVPWVALLGALAAACDGPSGASGTRAAGGRLTIRRDGRTLVDAPATAAYCATDSTTALFAEDGDWVVALSLRVPVPVAAPESLAVAAGRGGPGTARFAALEVRPESGAVLIGARGTVRLEAGPLAAGLVDLVAPTALASSDSVRITGTFRDVPIAPDLCPQPAP